VGTSPLSNSLLVFLKSPKPDEPESPVSVHCDSVLSLRSGGGSEIAEIRYSQGYSSLEFLISLPWAELEPEFINVQLRGASKRAVRAIRSSLRANGYRCLGSGREQTGTDVLFARCSASWCRVSDSLAWMRFRVGQKVVWARDNLFNSQVNRVRFERAAWVLRWRKSVPVLDHDFGLALSKVDPLKSQSVAIEIAGSSLEDVVPIEFDADTERCRVEEAVFSCHDKLGVWPISFSIPNLVSDIGAKKVRAVSEVIPGSPYSFSDYDEYLKQYQESMVGITHRKAGWDCFRHVEILAAGSLPYMLDSDLIPPYSMVHYPKNLIDSVTEQLESRSGIPVVINAQDLIGFLESSLTCRSMAKYIFRVSGLQDATRVLFVDENLGKMADYLSLFTLIGMKQLCGDNCSVLFPVPYVYTDWEGDSNLLYGRGFGYTRILEASTRGANEFTNESIDLDGISELEFDAVVVGNITRNRELARDLLSRFPAEKTIWIHGEDTPPLTAETEFLLNSGVNVFVRAIN